MSKDAGAYGGSDRSQLRGLTILTNEGTQRSSQGPAPEQNIEPLKTEAAGSTKPDMLFSRDRFVEPAQKTSLGFDTVLLVMASDRPNYLQKTLDAVAKYHPRSAVPIIVSEDGFHDQVGNVVSAARTSLDLAPPLTVKHLHWPNGESQEYENGYFRLADHFKWALSEVFSDVTLRRVIILEEDIEIAPDFFEFFTAVAPMLDSDPTLLAASAFNDNGFLGLVKDNEQLYRSDFFPGLGWMLTRSTINIFLKVLVIFND